VVSFLETKGSEIRERFWIHTIIWKAGNFPIIASTCTLNTRNEYCKDVVTFCQTAREASSHLPVLRNHSAPRVWPLIATNIKYEREVVSFKQIIMYRAIVWRTIGISCSNSNEAHDFLLLFSRYEKVVLQLRCIGSLHQQLTIYITKFAV
jgi:hypothetical protein